MGSLGENRALEPDEKRQLVKATVRRAVDTKPRLAAWDDPIGSGLGEVRGQDACNLVPQGPLGVPEVMRLLHPKP
jgi:hypothetical protein